MLIFQTNLLFLTTHLSKTVYLLCYPNDYLLGWKFDTQKFIINYINNHKYNIQSQQTFLWSGCNGTLYLKGYPMLTWIIVTKPYFQ